MDMPRFALSLRRALQSIFEPPSLTSFCHSASVVTNFMKLQSTFFDIF